jgi:hypothetical protein
MFNASGHTGKAQNYCGKSIDQEHYADNGGRWGFAENSSDCFRGWKKGKTPPGKNADDKKQR